MNPRHSSVGVNLMTPIPIIEMVREVLGEIDLDPASSHEANERIKARHFFSQDGLHHSWAICKQPTIFLNPPGGKIRNRSQAVVFWDRLTQYEHAGLLGHAIFIGFSLEILQTSQTERNDGWWSSVGAFPFCIPAKRICFDGSGGVPQTSPTHANVIAYVPGTIDKTDKFVEVFSRIGLVIDPRRKI